MVSSENTGAGSDIIYVGTSFDVLTHCFNYEYLPLTKVRVRVRVALNILTIDYSYSFKVITLALTPTLISNLTLTLKGFIFVECDVSELAR
jgi:hypothetical protein